MRATKWKTLTLTCVEKWVNWQAHIYHDKCSNETFKWLFKRQRFKQINILSTSGMQGGKYMKGEEGILGELDMRWHGGCRGRIEWS